MGSSLDDSGEEGQGKCEEVSERVSARGKMVWNNIGRGEDDVGGERVCVDCGEVGLMICFSLELRQLTMLYDAG
jgi:hypothetical protein